MNNLTWKRTSELVKIGFLDDIDNLSTLKRKCADLFGLERVNPNNLVVVHGGARVDEIAFATLGDFLSSLSAPAEVKIIYRTGHTIAYS